MTNLEHAQTALVAERRIKSTVYFYIERLTFPNKNLFSP